MNITLAFAFTLFFLVQFSCSSHPLNANSKSLNSPALTNEQKGQNIRWEKQGITFTVPLDWHKDESLSKDDVKQNDTFTNSGQLWRGPGDMSIEFNVESGDVDFPASESEMLEADYKTSKSNQVYKDTHYEEIDGTKGLYSRMDLDGERTKAYWLTYRHYKGKAQNVVAVVTGPKKDMDQLLTILKSTKLPHD